MSKQRYATIDQLLMWKAYLYSTTDIQTTGHLFANRKMEKTLVVAEASSFCCLGIAGKLFNLIPESALDGYTFEASLLCELYPNQKIARQHIFLPHEVQMFFAKLNDSGYSFKDISHYVGQLIEHLDDKTWRDIRKIYKYAIEHVIPRDYLS